MNYSYHVTRQAGEGVDAAQGSDPHFLFGRKGSNGIIYKDGSVRYKKKKKCERCTIAGLVVRVSRRVKRASSCAVRAGGGSMSSG